jgi:hypothetical protein
MKADVDISNLLKKAYDTRPPGTRAESARVDKWQIRPFQRQQGCPALYNRVCL